MALLTKDLLINLLILIIMCFAANISVGYFEYDVWLKRRIHGLIGGLAIVISIALSVQIQPGYIFDLRQIPFILVGLMEGPLISVVLLVITIISRLFIGGLGIFPTIIVYSLLTLFIYKLGPYYSKGQFSQKLLISLSLSLFCSLSLLIYVQIVGQSIWVSKLWTGYIIIPSFGTILLLSISEWIKKYFFLKREIFKTEKIQLVSHLAASFGHEVRNPICVSKGFLQLLLEEKVSSNKRLEYTRIALDELAHAEKIINDYLSFAKPQIEKSENFDFKEEIKTVVGIVTPMANMNNIVLHFSNPSELLTSWILKGERNLLHQCLLNIFKNSIEAMPKGGVLKVELLASKKIIGVRISDTGIGMTKEQLRRLGEPYFSAKEKGTGLGMMTVYSIVKAMYGKIKIDSEIGKGTTITLLFPDASYEGLEENAKYRLL
ncbi:ATP-binding protein [Neobacillus sp. PS3-40]|uniref:ATP-binding protein n=1 Tax=Neobacillus sp. PS3-40 TaxID=3070679 RepID=UPI0027DEE987|nr:ATP-binding protein [Neobacillus sp. PS3-40]WML44306.1 ATP-binding protein [Neobacillus sp. PS3-40]